LHTDGGGERLFFLRLILEVGILEVGMLEFGCWNVVIKEEEGISPSSSFYDYSL
jgi:hypothetical protein